MDHVCLLLSLCFLAPCCHGLSVVAVFNQLGVTGHVTFNQDSPHSTLTITVKLQDLAVADVMPIPWAVHRLPVPIPIPDSCQSVAGPEYRNLADLMLSETMENYSTNDITLYGGNSIVGRSLVINLGRPGCICATINYLSPVPLLWAPFRNNAITNGNVFLWQHPDQSFSSIYVNLTTRAESLLPWAITSACSGMGNGNLGVRNGNLTVSDGVIHQLLTDPGLTLGAVEGQMLVVGETGDVSCVTIVPYVPLSVVGEVGGGGGVEMTQRSPLDLTMVTVSSELKGLQIHNLPPGPDCSDTEGIFDPREAGLDSVGETFDFYPFGDLSRKIGTSLMYSDPYLSLSGGESVVGRSLVVFEEDGSISGCGLLRYASDVIEMRATLSMAGFSGTITFSQSAENPLSDTVITIETDITAEVEEFSITTTPSLTSTPSTTGTPSTISTPSTNRTVITSSTLSPSGTPLTTSASLTTSQKLVSPSPTAFITLSTVPPPNTSVPTLLLPYPTSSLPPMSSEVLLFPSTLSDILLPLPSPSPSPSPSSSLLMPVSSSVIVGGGIGRRRRSGRRREVVGEYSWTLRQWDSSALPDDCSELPIIGSSMGDCSHPPLSCPTGDLTGKHGLLQSGPCRAVFHDPYLPLSGTDSVVSAVLLVQPANGIGDSACVVVTMVTLTTTPSSQPLTSSVTSASPTTRSPQGRTGIDNAVLIAAVVGGVVSAALLLTALLLLVCLCVRKLRSHRVDLNKLGKEDKKDVELGHIQPHMEPQIGSDQYRAVCSYQPRNTESGDLALEKGEWVTLLEAPYGGEWWRGQAAAGEGWFPKTHVEYVDREAERRKAEEDNFKLAAAAIVAASSSFNERHRSLATHKTTVSSTRRRSMTTISKTDINSTPVMSAKFALDSGMVIENERHLSVSTPSDSRPDTPHNASDVTGNHVAMETSQGSSESSEAVLKLQPYIAKYKYVGGTEIELTLKKGDVVSVIEKAESGWWQGVCGGRVGWFPASYVKPAPSQERRAGGREEGKKEGREERATVDAREYQAIHTYSSQQEGDLQLTEGDTVLVYWVHDNGWYYGSCHDKHGWFPGTYVEPTMEAASPSPLPQDSEGQKGPSPLSQDSEGQKGPSPLLPDTAGPLLNKAAGESPSRKPHRRKWSFKKAKSHDELSEAGLIPLLESEVKGDVKKQQQTKPRRKAPPPPVSPSPGDKSHSTSPISHTPPLTQTTPAATPTAPSPLRAQPTDKPFKRRKTTSALDPHKPRRLPPSPPPSLTITSLTKPLPPHSKPHPPISAEDVKLVAPVAAPREKVRVKRVKRPETRLIPPPPTIPLPPPPTRTIAPPSPEAPAHSTENTTASPLNSEVPVRTEAATVEATTDRAVVKAVPAEVEKDKEEDVEDVKKSPKPRVKSKPPPVKPKPAHLSSIVSASNLSQARPSSPVSTVAQTRPSPPVQGSPKPPPPARSSSLHHPHPVKRREPKTSLTAIADSTSPDQVDHPTSDTPDIQQETAEAVRNLRSAPPSHPPPRPSTDTTTRRSNPPSFSPPQRSDTTNMTDTVDATDTQPTVSRSSSLKTRGSQLMRSLKKMVQRSESREEVGVAGVREGEIIQNLQTESSAAQRKVEDGPPARTPPPNITRQTSGETPSHQTESPAAQRKVEDGPPARTPPPNITRQTSGETPSHPLLSSTPDHTSSLPASAGPSPVHSAGSATSPSHSTSPQPPSSFYRVKVDYTAQSPSELTLHVGDILIEIDRPTSAMYYGMLDDGTTGLFPVFAVEHLVTPATSKSS